MGAYRLQWEMIKFAKEHDINRYNFYGITGDFSEDAEDAGVQKFKEGFNADVYEYIGDFVKPIKPIFYKLKETLENRKSIKRITSKLPLDVILLYYTSSIFKATTP